MHRGAGIGTCVFLIAELQFCTLHSAASSVACVPRAGFLPVFARTLPTLPHWIALQCCTALHSPSPLEAPARLTGKQLPRPPDLGLVFPGTPPPGTVSVTAAC